MNERSFIPPPHYVLVPLLEGQLIDTPSASLVTLMRDSCWADTSWCVPTCLPPPHDVLVPLVEGQLFGGRIAMRPYCLADDWRTHHGVSLRVGV